MTKTTFVQATAAELPQIHQMTRLAFKPLYECYHDAATNPYLETLESMKMKNKPPESAYYFFEVAGLRVGMVRLIRLAPTTMRLSPLLILPAYQNLGYAQLMLRSLETFFSTIDCWQLDTIAEEAKLGHLYRQAGYQQLGNRCELIQPGMHIVYFEKRL